MHRVHQDTTTQQIMPPRKPATVAAATQQTGGLSADDDGLSTETAQPSELEQLRAEAAAHAAATAAMQDRLAAAEAAEAARALASRSPHEQLQASLEEILGRLGALEVAGSSVAGSTRHQPTPPGQAQHLQPDLADPLEPGVSFSDSINRCPVVLEITDGQPGSLPYPPTSNQDGPGGRLRPYRSEHTKKHGRNPKAQGRKDADNVMLRYNFQVVGHSTNILLKALSAIDYSTALDDIDDLHDYVEKLRIVMLELYTSHVQHLDVLDNAYMSGAEGALAFVQWHSQQDVGTYEDHAHSKQWQLYQAAIANKVAARKIEDAATAASGGRIRPPRKQGEETDREKRASARRPPKNKNDADTSASGPPPAQPRGGNK